jgi:hypothetical protein
LSTTEAAIQINFKTKRDGMLINLRANDAIELDGLLDAVSQRLATLLDLESTVESMASQSAPAPAPSAAATITAAFPGAQVISQPPVAGYKPAGAPAPTCTGGACGGAPMRLVPAGIAKATGRPYKGFYACPLPQGQACQHKVPA